MTVCISPREVKQLVGRTFLDLGASSPSLFSLKETIFLDNGKCMGRAYHAGPLRAVWQIDEGVVHFYDHEGSLLRTVNLLEEKVPHLMAA